MKNERRRKAGFIGEVEKGLDLFAFDCPPCKTRASFQGGASDIELQVVQNCNCHVGVGCRLSRFQSPELFR